MLLYACLTLAAFICAVRAIRARHLLSAAIWLAGVSALVATIMYRLGAQQVAVVELSVGAGLVTVLFVFAISIAGDEGLAESAFFPNEAALAIVAFFVLLVGGLVLPLDTLDAAPEAAFNAVLWDQRTLDVLLQLVLIFTGVLCLLGLLADVPKSSPDILAEFPRAHISTALDSPEQRALTHYEAQLAAQLADRKPAAPVDSQENTL